MIQSILSSIEICYLLFAVKVTACRMHDDMQFDTHFFASIDCIFFCVQWI